MLFNGFNFSIAYHPGTHNCKPDALSRPLGPNISPSTLETILSPERVIGVLTWEVERTFWETQQQHPDPGTGPPNRLFVPDYSQLSCHPRMNKTIYPLRRHFWWPTLDNDASSLLHVPHVLRARHKSPAGLLQPLPMPGRPWSHIALDFASGLPVSKGNTAILTVVDCFSKAAHFVALSKRPTALEAANLLVNHVFRIHGLPSGIVSERGPQFISRVSKAFARTIGATVSLTSGYHPQTNGQAERTNQFLDSTLSCVTATNPSSWSDHLP